MGNDGHARGARILLYGLRSLNTSYIRKADLHYDEIGILNRCFSTASAPVAASIVTFPVLSHDGVLDDSARLKSNRMSDVRSPAIP